MLRLGKFRGLRGPGLFGIIPIVDTIPIDARTEPWGVQVISVEVRDVLIPLALQDAMSMQAQAERERQARVILGDSERQVALGGLAGITALAQNLARNTNGKEPVAAQALEPALVR